MASKRVIVDTLHRCINAVLKKYEENPSNTMTDDDIALCLCSCIEAMFLHKQEENVMLKLTKMIKSTSSLQPYHFNFWSFIQHYIPKNMVEVIEKSAKRRTPIGCCRVWVRIALNESTLMSYMEAVLREKQKLRNNYSRGAILIDAEVMMTVVGLLKSLESCCFALDTGSPFLNSWTNSTALQLAGIDCIPASFIATNLKNEIPSTEQAEEEAFIAHPVHTTRRHSEQAVGEARTTSSGQTDTEDSVDGVSSPTEVASSDSVDVGQEAVDNERLSVEERLMRLTEEQLKKDMEQIQADQSGSPTTSGVTLTSSTQPVSTTGEVKDTDVTATTSASWNSLLAHGGHAWWVPEEADHTDRKEPEGEEEEGATAAAGSYSQLWNQVFPNASQILTSSRSMLPSFLGGQGMGQADSDTSNIEAQTVGESNDRERRSVSIEAISDTSSSHGDWQLIGDELLQKRLTETPLLLDIYPGAEAVCALNGQNTVFAGTCPRCDAKLGMDNFALDHYDGRLYCRECHQNDLSIIPRDVVYNWDFSLKPVSMETKRFLSDLVSHPNIHLAQRNPGLYDVVPTLARLQKLRRQLSLLWFLLSSCDSRAASGLRERLFPREYMLGSLQEVDLYSIEDLIIANTGALEKDLQNAIDRLALPHVKTCSNCKSRTLVCDTCREGGDRVIRSYELDSYTRCQTHGCHRVIHSSCLPADQKSIYCRQCSSHLADERPPTLGGYDAIFPS